ncbi:glycosyltransferase family 2 protein [Methylovirgula sp. 4M-Z18]|uniref:glycosyltransferase family 2 protein n=1 Tax=Methylovirgula sp. 4M-Z18 TaxID=2293567 RepID=UPI001314ACA7|nr:glycosyltransferase family 2 protein [Methylovirgula sp. 4M-Z18]
MTAPNVSVIVAAWNAAGFIGNALRSALAQQGVTLEVLVIDDASTDATVQVVEALNDQRIRCIRLPTNQGPAGARNAGLAAAQGEWVAVLDADDTMRPHRLAQLVAFGRETAADIVADNLWVSTTNASRPPHLLIDEPLDGAALPVSLQDYFLDNLLFGKGRGLGYLKPLFRLEFLRGHALAYDPHLRIGEDFQLVAEALAQGAKFVRRRSADYDYQVHTGSISHRLSEANAQAMLQAADGFLARYAAQLATADRAAAEAYTRSLRQGAAFVAMVAALKRRRVNDFLTIAATNPAALKHMMMPVQARLQRFFGQGR